MSAVPVAVRVTCSPKHKASLAGAVTVGRGLTVVAIVLVVATHPSAEVTIA
ncbi:hypothetical protein DSECCO2_204350 [anaerobic digester metagenome]